MNSDSSIWCSMNHTTKGSKPWSEKMPEGEGLGVFSFLIYLSDGWWWWMFITTKPTKIDIKSTHLGEVVTTLQQLSLGMAKWPNGIWVPIPRKFIQKSSKNFGRKFYENKNKVHSKTWIHPFVSSFNCSVPGPSRWLSFLRSAGAGSIAVHLTSPLSW